MRAVVARYVKGATLRVSARVARSRRALGAGSRAECRYTVMQRAATVARTGKIEREGRGTARAPASIPRRRTARPAPAARSASERDQRPPPSAIDITPETPLISGRNSDTSQSFARHRTRYTDIIMRASYWEKYLVNYQNM